MSEKDGGAAFPVHPGHAMLRPDSNGMSLRDWFAGQALQGLFQSDRHIINRIDARNGLAEMCYEISDAMLKERTK